MTQIEIKSAHQDAQIIYVDGHRKLLAADLANEANAITTITEHDGVINVGIYVPAENYSIELYLADAPDIHEAFGRDLGEAMKIISDFAERESKLAQQEYARHMYNQGRI